MDATRTLIAAGIAALARVATTPVAPYGFGRDLVCVEDLTTTLRETDPTTVESLAQDLFHRITTERGTILDDPDFGTDARDFLSAGATPTVLLAIGGQLSLECLKDDRVNKADVDVVTGASSALNVTLAITPADPALRPFTMIVALTPGSIPTLEIQ